jgi:hypothetical protein
MCFSNKTNNHGKNLNKEGRTHSTKSRHVLNSTLGLEDVAPTYPLDGIG